MNNRHDGKAVAQVLTARSMGKADFARAMDLTERQVYRLLDRADWTATNLEKAGRILDTCFLLAYWPQDLAFTATLTQLDPDDAEAGRQPRIVLALGWPPKESQH